MSARTSGPGPVLVLFAAAAVPALLLASVWRWADGAAAESEDPVPATSSTVVAPPVPAPPLATGLVSFRRVPAAVSRDVNLEAFRTEVQRLTSSLNDQSCVEVSVDGVDAGSSASTLPVMPASVQKVVVAAVALDVLGEDFTYTTRVVGPSPAGAVIDGDVHLVGGGDPVLTSDWYPTSNLERFPVFNGTRLDALADAIADSGVTSITGRVLGDGSRYDDEFYAPGWGSGVAGLESGPYDALMANDARVLGDDLRSSEPNEAAARELVRLLGERGVTVAGGAGTGTAPADATELASVTSQPLSAIVAEMLTNSDNNTAELLVKELGVAAGGAGTREAGLAVMSSTLAEWGFDLTGVVLADGSGLSLDNRLTCDVLHGVLRRNAADGPLATGMPRAGVSGALTDVFVGTAVDGRLLGKTGTLNNPPFNDDIPAVKSLAGYLPLEGGGQIEYTLMLNGATISDQSQYRPVWDTLADVLGSYPAAAGADVLGPR